ncbi:MAG: zeta toxin family protein [Candidatus Dojkabacteria bacterium]|nr:zeta toxin family protein [Candidatus Dojkabacteria bacterium]
MLIAEIISKTLYEGVYDPHRFKAIFMAGTPGSGKTYISKKLFSNTGLKSINIDDLVELRIRKTGKQPDYATEVEKELYPKLRSRFSYYIENGMGLLIDVTGGNFTSVKNKIDKLKNAGYEIAMIYVESPKEEAWKRVLKRKEKTGRFVEKEFFDKTYENIKKNIPIYKSIFGKNFFHIINSEKETNYHSESIRIYKFLNKEKFN